MIEVITILAPVFVLIATGFILGRTSLFDERSTKALIAFVWYVAVPALLFRVMAGRELPVAEIYLVAAYYSAMLVVYALSVLIGRYLFKQPLDEQAMFAFASCFANSAFVGIPIMEGAYGAEGVRLLMVIFSLHSLTLLVVTTLLVQRHRYAVGGVEISSGRVLLKSLLSIRENPIVMSMVIGIIWSAFALPYPDWLDSILALPAAAAAPVGLFSVGLSLTTVKLDGDMPQASVGVLIKILLMPLGVYLLGAYVFHLTPLWLGVATLFAAMPAGLIPYSYALQNNIAPRRVASMILLSIIVAPLTLFATMVFLGVGQ